MIGGSCCSSCVTGKPCDGVGALDLAPVKKLSPEAKGKASPFDLGSEKARQAAGPFHDRERESNEGKLRDAATSKWHVHQATGGLTAWFDPSLSWGERVFVGLTGGLGGWALKYRADKKAKDKERDERKKIATEQAMSWTAKRERIEGVLRRASTVRVRVESELARTDRFLGDMDARVREAGAPAPDEVRAAVTRAREARDLVMRALQGVQKATDELAQELRYVQSDEAAARVRGHLDPQSEGAKALDRGIAKLPSLEELLDDLTAVMAEVEKLAREGQATVARWQDDVRVETEAYLSWRRAGLDERRAYLAMKNEARERREARAAELEAEAYLALRQAGLSEAEAFEALKASGAPKRAA